MFDSLKHQYTYLPKHPPKNHMSCNDSNEVKDSYTLSLVYYITEIKYYRGAIRRSDMAGRIFFR